MRLSWTFWHISDIMEHFGTFWNNSEGFVTNLEHLDCFPSPYRPFSPTIDLNRFIEKARYGRTDRPTDGQTDPLIEMRGRILKHSPK